MADDRHHVVIGGGGFGGLTAARALRRSNVRITLVDRRNFHLFQPLLYQVATGGLSPANIAAPLRAVLKRQRNVEVVLGEIVDVDLPGRRVLLADGQLPYDTLILAPGVRHHYFGNENWSPLAPGLKTVEDATDIRRRILLAFETAEQTADPSEAQRLLTFAVVGAGPTGVELAGAIGELARHTLRRDFRHIDTTQARVLLVEGADRVLPGYQSDLSMKAERSLSRLGVTVLVKRRVVDVGPQSITLEGGDEKETIPTGAVFWAAGVKASPLGAALADASGAQLDRLGRVVVEPDCTLPSHPEVFVIGDLAHFSHGLEQPLPAMAPVAMQQGGYVAEGIDRRLRGLSSPPFRYRNRGNMATIGRSAAVANIGGRHFSGFLAWLIWLTVHLVTLIGFENRLLVLTQWAWNYFTRNRAARLITGDDLDPP